MNVKKRDQSDNPEFNNFYTLDVVTIDPGREVVFNWDQQIAESRNGGNVWPLEGNVQGLHIETSRVLELIEEEKQAEKIFRTTREKICTAPVIEKNTKL